MLEAQQEADQHVENGPHAEREHQIPDRHFRTVYRPADQRPEHESIDRIERRQLGHLRLARNAQKDQHAQHADQNFHDDTLDHKRTVLRHGLRRKNRTEIAAKPAKTENPLSAQNKRQGTSGRRERQNRIKGPERFSLSRSRIGQADTFISVVQAARPASRIATGFAGNSVFQAHPLQNGLSRPPLPDLPVPTDKRELPVTRPVISAERKLLRPAALSRTLYR